MSVRNVAIVSFEGTGQPETVRPPIERVVTGDPVQTIDNRFTDGTGQFFSGIWSCTPGSWRVRYTESEFCHILEGHVVLTDSTGTARTFRAGDSFAIPAGFEGTWEVVELTRKLYAIFEPKS